MLAHMGYTSRRVVRCGVRSLEKCNREWPQYSLLVLVNVTCEPVQCMCHIGDLPLVVNVCRFEQV